jgi:hypothetical protein
VELEFGDGRSAIRSASFLDRESSDAVFSRSGEITLIRAFVPETALSTD